MELFGEVEICVVTGTVNEGEPQHSASSPVLFGFPDVGVLIAGGVIRQATRASALCSIPILISLG
jgi:hypothetical protein